MSYADFITLLFAFFVVLYASAQVDKQRMGQLSAAIHEGFQDLGAFQRQEQIEVQWDPALDTRASATSALAPQKPPVKPQVDDIKALQTRLQHALSNEIARKEVSIAIGPEGLILSLREVGFFDSGSAEMRPEAVAAFSRIADLLRQQPHKLRIEGHTDDVPIHTSRFTSNWELSTARATEVIRLLVTQYGFAPDRLSAAGYGEFHPVADNHTLDGRGSNRRVDVVVLSESRER